MRGSVAGLRCRAVEAYSRSCGSRRRPERCNLEILPDCKGFCHCKGSYQETGILSHLMELKGAWGLQLWLDQKTGKEVQCFGSFPGKQWKY